RILLFAAAFRGGHDVHGGGNRHRAALHRARTDGDFHLRAGWFFAPRPALQRSGLEVSAARRIFVGHLCLRPLAVVRTFRPHQPGGHCARGLGAESAQSGGGDRVADDHGRVAVQDRRRSLSSVGAGRLRRRAHQHYWLHVGGGESGGLGAAAAHSCVLVVVAALTQTNTKRLLAYSSIAHVGYMLLAFVAMGTSAIGSPGFLDGFKGILIYLLVYTFMNLGAFAVITSLRQRNVIGDELDDMAGLYQRAPVEAALMLLFLLSLAGIPPAAGFLGKYYIFLSLIESGHYGLASLGVLYSLFGLYYY